LQKVLYTKLLEPVIKERQLNLNLDAVKYLKEYISNKEVETGEKNTKFDISKITYDLAMQEEHVAKEMNDRASKLSELCEQFIIGLTDNVSQLPYGLRFVCKMFDYFLKQKHPKSTESQRYRVVGFLAFYKFMNPAIVSPDGYELTRKPISTQTRQNLIAISKVLINLSNGVMFDLNMEPYWKPMNDWIQKYEDLYLSFIKKIIQVPDAEEQLGVDEYMELTQKSNPTITIKWNEIFQTHKILVDFLNKVATDENDPIKIILSEKGMEKAPEELSKELDEEVKLPLINKFATIETEKQQNVDEIYEQMKENLRKVLKALPPQSLGDNIITTLNNGSQIQKKLLDENKNDENAKNILQLISNIENAIPDVEKGGKISKKLNYREILIDITKDIKDMKQIRVKQKKEYDRLKDNVSSLQTHQKFLQEKVDDFEKYKKDSTEKMYKKDKNKGTKSNKKFKFSYSQLKKKVLLQLLIFQKIK